MRCYVLVNILISCQPGRCDRTLAPALRRVDRHAPSPVPVRCRLGWVVLWGKPQASSKTAGRTSWRGRERPLAAAWSKRAAGLILLLWPRAMTAWGPVSPTLVCSALGTSSWGWCLRRSARRPLFPQAMALRCSQWCHGEGCVGLHSSSRPCLQRLPESAA